MLSATAFFLFCDFLYHMGLAVDMDHKPGIGGFRGWQAGSQQPDRKP
jgi:hypothetical protein